MQYLLWLPSYIMHLQYKYVLRGGRPNWSEGQYGQTGSNQGILFEENIRNSGKPLKTKGGESRRARRRNNGSCPLLDQWGDLTWLLLFNLHSYFYCYKVLREFRHMGSKEKSSAGPSSPEHICWNIHNFSSTPYYDSFRSDIKAALMFSIVKWQGGH